MYTELLLVAVIQSHHIFGFTSEKYAELYAELNMQNEKLGDVFCNLLVLCVLSDNNC